jgi:predicted nucleotidyltransferase
VTKIDERSPAIELTEQKLRHLTAVLDRGGVVAASLSGSQASGRAGPLSDVDVAVWLDPAIDRRERFDRRMSLMAEAAAALETSEVDLVVPQRRAAPPAAQGDRLADDPR